MAIFEASFWKFVWPFLLFGSGGAGVKLYFRDDGNIDVDFLDTSSGSSGTSAISPPVSTVAPKKTFKDKFQESHLKVVTSGTNDNILQNLLLQRIYPHYSETVKYSKDRMFTGFPATDLEGKKYTTNSSKTIFVLNQATSTEASALRTACITALETEYKEKEVSGKMVPDGDFYKVKAWCTEPTVKVILARHKFTLLKTDEKKKDDDEDWKEVIAGGWFNSNYKDKQSFLSDTDLTTLTGITEKSSVTDAHIKILKNKCKSVLEKAFERKAFPAPKSFIDELQSQDKKELSKVDEFQEAALFCSKPMSAKDYVEKAMQGVARTTMPTTDKDLKDDFCLIAGKQISDYENVKTNQPFEGKSFWCAVRVLYEKSKSSGK